MPTPSPSPNPDDGPPLPLTKLADNRLVLGYSSRSTLSLRGQGIGLPELRLILASEKEVLFGFLRFRRRGIVLQYTHPECSRVVKGKPPLGTAVEGSACAGSFGECIEFLPR
jgi:hypothetical protein